MLLHRDLNARQEEAVTYDDKPLLVIAGPGTGKTRVITFRVAYLIETQRARPDQILAVTFTNKAAQELLERVQILLGEGVTGEVWVGTFHNVCSRILRQEGASLDIPPDFTVFDQETQHAILADCLRKAGMDPDIVNIARVRDMISLHKSQMRNPVEQDFEFMDDDGNVLEPDVQERYRQVIREYGERLAALGAMDFDDLLVTTVERLGAYPEVLEKYRDRFRHILVDEYQDINHVQYELLKLLTPPPYRITAVGDENQSIYAWRGASPEWMLRFREDYKPHVIELDEHYRSTQTILDAATALIRRNGGFRETPLTTDSPAGHPIWTYAVGDTIEAASVITKLVRQLRSTPIAYRDIAIFYRNHRNADDLEDALRRAGIPLQRVRPLFQWMHSDESRLLSWLRFLSYHLDKHLLDALTFPTPILDEWRRVWFQSQANRKKVALFDVLTTPSEDVPPLSRVTLERTFRRMSELSERISKKSALEAVRELIAELELHRNPFHANELAAIPPVREFPQLQESAEMLFAALTRGDAVSLFSDAELDDVSAATLVQTVLSAYFDTDAALEIYDDVRTPVPAVEGISIVFGNLKPSPEQTTRTLWLNAPDGDAASRPYHPRAREDAPQIASWVAYRLCQHVLALAETPEMENLIAYAIGTTGPNIRSAGILEFAGTRLGEPEESEHLYVRPKYPLSEQFARSRGMDPTAMRDQPPIEQQIKRIREFLNDSILVGHNATNYQNRILSREMETNLRRPLLNPTYDTLTVADRLDPHGNHELESLAERFGIPFPAARGAEHEVEVIQRLFRRLTSLEAEQRANMSLAEFLPFVAIGAQSQGEWESDALTPYRIAAARWLKAHSVRQGVLDLLPEETHVDAGHYLDEAARVSAPESDEERRWQAATFRFLSRVQRFDETSDTKTLPDFLTQQTLADPLDELDPKADAVTLMTLHSAKGTEFRIVIMTGMEEGILPSGRAIKRPETLAEERRLCYVGMMRAKERLYFVTSRRREGKDRVSSRFLREIPASLMKQWSPKG